MTPLWLALGPNRNSQFDAFGDIQPAKPDDFPFHLAVAIQFEAYGFRFAKTYGKAAVFVCGGELAAGVIHHMNGLALQWRLLAT